ncbi:chromophore lyase CpcT/CpeT [Aquimarina pacifica]|uniref:chromophore lyase CpcT/CpeT n=1 Tax=Aquimarina pacifica TaxID=1296415 RepID=UPI00046F6F0F|nr:chromophore lyase CpcT/CpeT [Aquimarina pacifica]
MLKLLRIVLVFLLLSACSSPHVKDPELHELVSLMVGEFSNEKQSKIDTGFAHLKLKNTRIWKDKPSYWVYSELSEAENEESVQSQRIINYQRLDSLTFTSTNYTIPDAKKYLGSFYDTKAFDTLDIDLLETREGCVVYFKKKTSTIYFGKTDNHSCSSRIDYIDYIKSNFVVSKDNISVWIRGYNRKGKQVLGKINGPYKYKRIIE